MADPNATVENDQPDVILDTTADDEKYNDWFKDEPSAEDMGDEDEEAESLDEDDDDGSVDDTGDSMEDTEGDDDSSGGQGEEDEGRKHPPALTIDGKEYGPDDVKQFQQSHQTLANVEAAYSDDPVGFLTRLTENLEMEEFKALTDVFAKKSGLEVVDPETGDDYEYKPDPAAVEKRKAAKLESENKALKQEQQQTAWANEWDAATKAVGLTYTDADKTKVSHPRNIAFNLWLADKELTAEQALKKVLAEMKPNNQEADVKKKNKPKARPTPPRLADVDDPFDENAAFERWRKKNVVG